MTDQLSMAVVGFGHFGRYHAEKVSRLPGAKLVAVADIDAKRAAEAGALHGLETVPDYRALLGQVDAVSIAVPTSAHFEIARAFLESGADVLVEKPITDDVASATKLVEIARREGRILQVGHLERFSGVVEALRKNVRRPLYIDSTRIAPFKMRGTDVNVILDLMIHDLDLVLCFVEAPILSVDAAGAPVFSASEDIASARIKFTNGCIANIVASRISLKTERRMRIFETDAYATVDFEKRTIKTITRTADKRPPGVPPVDIVGQDYSEGDPLEREIEAFISAVIDRSEPVVSGEDGLEALKAAVLVNESLRAHLAFVRDIGADRPPARQRA